MTFICAGTWTGLMTRASAAPPEGTEPIPSKVPDLRGVPWGEQPGGETQPEFSSSI